MSFTDNEEWTFNDEDGFIMAGNKRIAQVFGATKHNQGDNRSECFANARLIQYAPEMYDLLIDILIHCDTDYYEKNIKNVLENINGEKYD